jgi:iron(III) transport system substrate-binding protein
VRRALVFLVLLVLLLATACGSSDDGGSADGSAEPAAPTAPTEEGSGYEETLAALEGLSGDERRAKLVELVQAEDGLTFYTSMSPSVVDEVVSAFEDEFGIDVALYRATSEVVLARLIEEAAAGFHGADVVESSGLEMVNLAAEGVLVPYESPSVEGIVPEALADGYTASRFNTFVLSWNTDLVPAGEEPKSWEELADPKWKGRLAVDSSDVDWFKTLWEHWVDEGMSEDEADRLAEAMAANFVVVNGHTVLGELMAAGEFELGVNYLHIVENLAAEGAPLAWQPAVEPIFPRANGVGLVRGAEHPAAAMLFYDWLLAEGQEVLLAVNTTPVRADLGAAADLEQVTVDLPSLAAEQAAWGERWDNLLRLGEVGPEG